MNEKDFNMEENEKNTGAVEEQTAEFMPEEEEASPKKSLKKEIVEWVQAIVIAVVLALVIRNFIFTVVRVDGQSMEPTLQHNDRLIVWRLGYEAEQGDVVVFNPPGYDDNIYWIKRVIAKEGQHVEIDYTSGSVFVDGEKIDEPYLGEPMVDKGYMPITEIDVPEDCVFVLGDNRNNSTDGRVIGPVSEDRLVGKAALRFWPFNKVKTY